MFRRNVVQFLRGFIQVFSCHFEHLSRPRYDIFAVISQPFFQTTAETNVALSIVVGELCSNAEEEACLLAGRFCSNSQCGPCRNGYIEFNDELCYGEQRHRLRVFAILMNRTLRLAKKFVRNEILSSVRFYIKNSPFYVFLEQASNCQFLY